MTASQKDLSGAEQYAVTIKQLYHELKSIGRNSQDTLLGLLENDDPAVQRWAADHAMEFAPGMGKPVLEKLAKKGSGVLSEDAKVILREWHKTHLEALK